MILPKMISFLTIFLILPAFLLVNGQASASSSATSNTGTSTSAVVTSAPSVSPSTAKPSFLQQICLNLDEYRSLFRSILSDNSIFSRDMIARTITWTDWCYNTYDKYKWIVDFGLGILATLSPFLPGGVLVPMAGKVGVGIFMNENMRRLIKETGYEVWSMIPPTGMEKYDVSMENSMVIVRPVASAAAKMFKRSIQETDWSAVIGSLSERLADLQRAVIARKSF